MSTSEVQHVDLVLNRHHAPASAQAELSML